MAGLLPQAEALLGAGHAVHLGVLGSPPWPEEAPRLWENPNFSIGHAVPRRDGWRGVAADSLPKALRNGLPPDPGILAYLAQLDLDLLLLGAVETDYLGAIRRLGIPAAVIATSPEAALAQAAPGAIKAAPPDPTAALWFPILWVLRAWRALTRPSEDEASDGGGGDLGGRIQEGYARRVYPALADLAASLAPADRPLLKGELTARLDRGVIANEISAEGVMAAAAEGRGPVVLGPWWGEPELELLYWTPFLRWWRRRYQVDKDRLVAVSTGAAAPWYQDLGQYQDLSELYEPALLADLERSREEELAARRKRFGVTTADRQILKRMDRRLGFRGLNVLPPWVMAVAFERYWSGEDGPALLAGRTRAQGMKIKEKLVRRRFPQLPPTYAAFGATGSMEEMEPLLRGTAAGSPVVILAEPEAAGWADAMAVSDSRIQSMVLEAGSAKDVATTVLAGAAAYVGPPGWMAYAAAGLGKRALCLRDAATDRDLIDQAAAARLFSPAPLVLGPDDMMAAMGVPGPAPAETVH